MAQEKIFKIKVEGTEQVVKNIDELETSVKQLEDKLKTTDIGTPEFKALQNEVKKARGTLKDFELQIEGLDKEQRATALVDAFTGLTGAVGAVSAGFLAFGANSEQIENVERKLLGVIGVVSGLRDASNGLVATQKLVGNVNLKEVVPSFVATGKAGLKSLTTLKGGVRALVGATGIGLLLVALSAVIENWEKISSAIGLGQSEQEKFVATATENVEAQQDALDAISQSENILKLSGKSEREILNLKIAQTDEVISALEAQLTAQEELKQQQIDAGKRNAEILGGILNFLTAPLQLVAKAIDTIVNKLTPITGISSNLAGSIRDLNASVSESIFGGEDEELNEGIENTKKQLNTLKNQRAGYQLAVQAIDKKASDDRQAQRDKETQEAEDTAKAQADAELQAKQGLNDALRDLALARLDNQKEIAKQELDNQLAVLEEQRLAELANKDLTEQAKLDIEAKYNAQRESAQIAYNGRIAEINQEASDKADEERQKQLDDAIALEEAKFALTSQSLGAINNLLGAFQSEDEERNKKIFEAQKAFSIAQAILETYSAVQSVFANAAANPATILFPAQPYIQAGIALANGLANVAKIRSTTFETKSASGGGGGQRPQTQSFNGSAGTSLGAPQTTIPSLGGTNTQGGDTTTTTTGTPVMKTYVLAGDVSSAQEAENKINQRRTL